jgi:hypothetical protein
MTRLDQSTVPKPVVDALASLSPTLSLVSDMPYATQKISKTN